MPSTTVPRGTKQPWPRPTLTRPEYSVGKNLHAGFRTTSVLAAVLISVTVFPLIFMLLGAAFNELSDTQWMGVVLAFGLSLPILGYSFSLLLGLVRKGYVLVMNDQGVTYSQAKKSAQPIAWARMIAVEEKLTLDKEDAQSANFKVSYLHIQEDGTASEKALWIDQSLLDVERRQIRAVFEDRIGPLDVVEQAQSESLGSKFGRGVVITVATAVTDKIMK